MRSYSTRGCGGGARLRLRRLIVTLTPNPSLDHTLEIDKLEQGAVIRARASRVEAGGKGVNVARALMANGHDVRAVAPVGGAEGHQLSALLSHARLQFEAVPIGAALRANVSVVEVDGTVTKINAPGPTLTGDEINALVNVVSKAAHGAAWLAACGSLPPGAPAGLYGDITVAVRGVGCRVAVDTSGEALGAAARAGPDVCKPNADELAELVRRPLPTLGAVVDAAEELRGRGVGAVLVSLGRDGAVLVDDDGAAHAQSSPLTPVSNVGAGDATLAGFLAAGGAGRVALRQAVAWGAAAVRLPGSAMPTPDCIDVEEVRVTPVDRGRLLVQ